MFAQLGTFTTGDDASACLDLAAAGFRRYGLDVWFPPDEGEFIIAGGDDRVAVHVSCAPVDGGTWVAVVGYSCESDAVAEYGRNAIRESMTNPAIPPIPPV
jgi:hypothetical protein